MADIDLTPTEEMAANAKRGLELRRKHGRGGTAVGVARARDISNRKTLSPETVRRMHAFFSRHEKNKAGGEDDAGYIAWMLWSGDAGQGWAKRKVEQMDKSENQRSDTYKEIAQRLGSAATNDRPGAKARMGRAEKVMRDGSVHLDFTAAKEWLSVAKDAELRYIVADSKSALNANPDGKKFNYYRDLVLEAMKELKKRGFSRPGAKAAMGMTNAGYKMLIEAIRKHGASAPANVVERAREMKADPTEFTDNEVLAVIAKMKQTLASRPGAKASFAQDARAVAQEILRQLGGGRFMAMVGGKNAMHGTFGGKPGLQVSIGKGAEGGINRLIVTLDPATDTYNMEFWRIGNRGLSTKKLSEASMVYADDLQRIFTDRTKFYTSMSRPGEKTEMAAIDAGMMDGAGNEVVIRMADGSRATARYNRGTGKWSLEGHADVPAFAKVRDLVAHLTKQGMARPGDKSKMGANEMSTPEAIAKMMEAWNKIEAQAKKQFPNASKEEIYRITKDAMNHALRTKFSRPGAKDTNAVREGCKISAEDEACLKMMAAADEKVSDKIRTLIAEGKPQKQAVAIALDLKRRGEL